MRVGYAQSNRRRPILINGLDVVVHNADSFRVWRMTGKVFLSAFCVKRLLQCLQKVNHGVVGPLRSRLVPNKLQLIAWSGCQCSFQIATASEDMKTYLRLCRPNSSSQYLYNLPFGGTLVRSLFFIYKKFGIVPFFYLHTT